MEVHWLKPSLDAAIDAGKFGELVNELTNLLWETANLPCARGGLPTLYEAGIFEAGREDLLVLMGINFMRRLVERALDNAI